MLRLIGLFAFESESLSKMETSEHVLRYAP
jgi:hypothetical protein